MPKGSYPRPSPEERFWAKVNRNGPTPEHNPGLGPCWLWTGTKFRNGYGLFFVSAVHGSEKRALAHRYAYEQSVGPIPDRHDLDHVCHSTDPECAGGWTCPHRCCVNPAHLRPATRRQNLLEGAGQTIPSRHAAKTYCPQGHPYNEENTESYYGERRCRECRRAHIREYYQRNRAERLEYMRRWRQERRNR